MPGERGAEMGKARFLNRGIVIPSRALREVAIPLDEAVEPNEHCDRG